MTNKYIINTKNGASIILADAGGGDVNIKPSGIVTGITSTDMLYGAYSLRILSAELLTAANKLEAGTLFEEEFDWDTVESGMGFTDVYYDRSAWYVAMDWDEKDRVVMARDSDCDEFISLRKSDLTRAPEHDIKKAAG